MNVEQAKQLITLMKSKPVYEGGEWVRASCPLAKWRHQNGSDSSPSFGIYVKEGEHSHFHCFSCLSGSLPELVGALTMHLQKTPDLMALYPLKQIHQLIDDETLEVLPLPDYTEFTPDAYEAFQEWPQYFLDSFTHWNYNKEATDYLKKRGITHDQAKAHDIRWDTKKRMVVFPYWNVYGKLAGMRGRCIDKDAKYHHHDYLWNKINNAQLTWYNEPVLQNEEPVVIVEGQFDAMTVERAYHNVLANLTAKPSAFKMKRLQQASGVILMLDNDVTGKAATQLFLKYLDRHKIPTAVVELPEGVKDPDEAGTEWVYEQLKELGVLS